MSEPTLADHRSKLKEFIASIATIRGDLSNITAPPFVLDTKSAVELPAFWAERPSIFVAAAASPDPAERALLVLKWFLSSLRNQQYAGRSAAQGVKKPINAFLGEVFLATWEDGACLTRLVSEQVSHHPPVTACRVWNEEHGVSAEGYTRQEITFTGSVNIRQTGHATLHLARHDETYLIPLPDIKIKGILSGSPYPELQGSHRIPSTSGYTSVIDFGGGKGLFSSFSSGADKKHSFAARVCRTADDDTATPLYSVSGHWDGQFTIRDCVRDVDVETFDVATAQTTALTTDPLAAQDPWESRRAWRGVREALEAGDMPRAAQAKARVENGQREMRTTDAAGKTWTRLFYEAAPQPDAVALALTQSVGLALDPLDTVGAWRFRRREWEEGCFEKPYRGGLMPDNTHVHVSGGGDETANEAEIEDWDQGNSDGIVPGSIAMHTSQSTLVQSEPPRMTGSEAGMSCSPPPTQPQTQKEKQKKKDDPTHLARASSTDTDSNTTPATRPPSTGRAGAVARTVGETDQAQMQMQSVSGGDGDGMAETEKAVVEEFLRDRYSSREGL